MAKGMSLDECVRTADKLIQAKGQCLLLFDVKGSGHFYDKIWLVQKLQAMMDDINKRFYDYLPYYQDSSGIQRGFKTLFGDSSWAAINKAQAIPKIVDYQARIYPGIPLYWSVSKDLWEGSARKFILE